MFSFYYVSVLLQALSFVHHRNLSFTFSGHFCGELPSPRSLFNFIPCSRSIFSLPTDLKYRLSGFVMGEFRFHFLHFCEVIRLWSFIGCRLMEVCFSIYIIIKKETYDSGSRFDMQFKVNYICFRRFYCFMACLKISTEQQKNTQDRVSTGHLAKVIQHVS